MPSFLASCYSHALNLIRILMPKKPARPPGIRARTLDSRSVPLTPDERMDNYLIGHAVDPAYARNGANLTAIGVLQARELKFKPALDGIWIPYYHPLLPAGTLLETRRLRPFEPPPKRKFIQPPYTPVELYFDPHISWKPIFKSSKQPLRITEGEIKAMAACAAGFATAGMGGKDNFGGEELTPLMNLIEWEGRHVYLLLDSDVQTNPDVRYSRDKLARILTGRGAVVHLPPMPDIVKGGKTDLNDLLLMPGGADWLRRLCEIAPIFGVEPEYKPNLRTATEVTAMVAKWLWDDYLELGTITGMSGDPSVGKTFVGLAIAAALSKGHQPGATREVEKIKTLYISSENSPEKVSKPRFVALGGDTDYLVFLDDIITLRDINKIERAIDESGAKLIIFDPLQSYLTGVDMHRSNETRPVLDGLIRLAERKEVCILLLRHLTKASGGRAIHRALGSVDITAAVRTEFLIGNPANEPLNKALILVKTNNGIFPPPVAFTIEPLTKEIDGLTIKTAKLTWKGVSKLTLADLTGPETKTSVKVKTQVELAIEYLKEELKDGKRLQKELVADASQSERVLQRAAQIMHIVKKREKGTQEWTWELPPEPKYAKGGAQQKGEKEEK